MGHRNARLTPITRLELVQEVADGWSQAEVARQFRVSRPTVQRWVRRYRRHGEAGLEDRSSAPHRHPQALRFRDDAAWLRRSRNVEFIQSLGRVGLKETAYRARIPVGVRSASATAHELRLRTPKSRSRLECPPDGGAAAGSMLSKSICRPRR